MLAQHTGIGDTADDYDAASTAVEAVSPADVRTYLSTAVPLTRYVEVRALPAEEPLGRSPPAFPPPAGEVTPEPLRFLGEAADDVGMRTLLDHDALVDALVEPGALASVYQPIVDLDSGRTVAYEALVRPLDDLAAAVARRDVRRCTRMWPHRRAGLGVPGGSGRRRPPCGAGEGDAAVRQRRAGVAAQPRPQHLATLMSLANQALRVVVEVTERALLHDPAALVPALAGIRRNGMGIALDDVGADPASLALLPLVEPDVIKLDMRLVRRHTDAEIASIIGAVAADAERRGATRPRRGHRGRGARPTRPRLRGQARPGMALRAARPTARPSAVPPAAHRRPRVRVDAAADPGHAVAARRSAPRRADDDEAVADADEPLRRGARPPGRPVRRAQRVPEPRARHAGHDPPLRAPRRPGQPRRRRRRRPRAPARQPHPHGHRRGRAPARRRVDRDRHRPPRRGSAHRPRPRRPRTGPRPALRVPDHPRPRHRHRRRPGRCCSTSAPTAAETARCRRRRIARAATPGAGSGRGR